MLMIINLFEQVSKVKKKVKTMSLDEVLEREREAAALMEQSAPNNDFYVPKGEP